MPEKTLHAFAEHGSLKKSMDKDGGDSENLLITFSKLGIDIEALAIQLQHDGAQAFVKSWQQLLQRIAEKTSALSGKNNISKELKQ